MCPGDRRHYDTLAAVLLAKSSSCTSVTGNLTWCCSRLHVPSQWYKRLLFPDISTQSASVSKVRFFKLAKDCLHIDLSVLFLSIATRCTVFGKPSVSLGEHIKGRSDNVLF